MSLEALYRPSLALLTDLYQLTMACGYRRAGIAEREAVFHLVFRRHPFGGGWTIACGLELVIEALGRFRFEAEDLDYLRGLTGSDDRPLFDADFLGALASFEFACDVDGLPEGSVVFPGEPLLRVRGPIWQGQLLESLLLNLVNYPTLVATQAARVCQAAGDDDVLEFGLRRAQGIDGALTASRAAYIGGCAATSNVLAGRIYGIPVRGTHAHSWVLAFDDEAEAFAAYAEAMPGNCVFLVDTFDSISGVRNAIDAGRELEDRGGRLAGIRLDSGDLAGLSRTARAMLDEAGFTDTAIVASNDLDEYLVSELKADGAAINTWGVGTRLVTAWHEPALGGVYKLAAIRDPGQPWQPRAKRSDDLAKSSDPGILQVRRFRDENGVFIGDVIYDESDGELAAVFQAESRNEPGSAWTSPSPDASFDDLLQPVFRGGRLIADSPSLEDIRGNVRAQLAALPDDVRRLESPGPYPVGLEAGLAGRKRELLGEAEN